MTTQQPPHPYHMRPAQPADRTQVQELVRSVLVEYGLPPDRSGVDADLATVPNSYTEQGGFFGVIEDDKQNIVGTFGLYPLSETTAEVRKMYLKPRTRGFGLGNYMLHYLIDLACEKGYNVLQLETASALKEAIILYEKRGFKKLDKNPDVSRCDAVYELKLQ